MSLGDCVWSIPFRKKFSCTIITFLLKILTPVECTQHDFVTQLVHDLYNNSPYPYYASELKLYHQNDPILFPNRELPKPGPVLTPDGMQEHEIKQILDMQPHGRGHQYLI